MLVICICDPADNRLNAIYDKYRMKNLNFTNTFLKLKPALELGSNANNEIIDNHQCHI